MRGIIPPLPHTFSLRGAYVSTRTVSQLRPVVSC